MVQEKHLLGGSSSNHSGIDIGAPTGTNILAISNGTVTFTGFKGAGGYTITIQNNVYTISYCHVSPIMIVSIGQSIQKGQIISQVGPKYVYNVPSNPYHDSNGKPTNGATTGAHLHLTMREHNQLVNPLNYLSPTKVGVLK